MAARQRISVKDMLVEKKKVYAFFFVPLLGSGFHSTEQLYKEFKEAWPKTRLSLNGFGRLLPKHFKRAVKRMDDKLYRGVIL